VFRRTLVVLGLIVVGVLARTLPHPPNVTPLTAIALLGGVYLTRRWTILLPLTIVALSDSVIGWHSTVPFTWSAFALTGLVSWWVRVRPSMARIVTGSLSGSLVFFLLTNFGVWATQNLYPKTIEGLWQCYVAALPFLRNSLIGDVVCTAVLFGACGWLLSLKKPEAVPVSG
jgi:hypothetical protein